MGGTLVMLETMAPCMGQLSELFDEISGSLASLKAMLLELHEMAVFDEDGDEIENTFLFKQTHHQTIMNRCPRIQARCRDVTNQFSLLLADVEEVPFDREKYAGGWLDE